MTRVFIDGAEGTAGLRIREKLEGRAELDIIALPEDKRKDAAYRRDALNSCDIAILCLPDAAAVEAVGMIDDPKVRVIDTSTAHRIKPGWVYGLPELEGKREAIAAAKRVGNPGCHASGFIVLVEPLVRAGIIPPELGLCCFSLTGYSGGGKGMIAEYEADERDELYDAPRQYALSQRHKHLPEMTAISALQTPPIFCPVVADYYCGMEVTVPLFARDIKGSIGDIRAVYAERYTSPIVHYEENADEAGLMSAGKIYLRDDMEISVHGNSERILLVSRFDNLGKGAAGAAVQNLNIMLGLDETTGLILEG